MPSQSTPDVQSTATAKNQTSDQKIIELLQKSLEYNEAILKICQKTKRYMLFSQIMAVVKILMIVAPVILAIIYLPPLIKQVVAPYQEFLQGAGGQSEQINDILKQLPGVQGSEQLKNLLK